MWSRGVPQVDSMEPAMFSLSLQGGRAEFEGRGVEVFAYMDNVTLGLMGISTSTVRNSSFGASSTAIIIDVNAAKTLALPPPKTLLSDNEGISLSASVDVRMAEGRRLTVVDVSNDTK